MAMGPTLAYTPWALLETTAFILPHSIVISQNGRIIRAVRKPLTAYTSVYSWGLNNSDHTS
jgi:hypothetical protein